MNQLLWLITAILAVLFVPASGIAFQYVTRNDNQQPGEER